MFVRQTKSLVYSELFSRRVATAMKTNPAAALIVAPKVRLWKGTSFNPTPATLLAAFSAEVADFTDYVEKTPTFSDPANLGPDVDGLTSTVSWLIQEAGAVTQNQIGGYYIADGTDLIAFERWQGADVPNMALDGDLLVLTLALPVRQLQNAF